MEIRSATLEDAEEMGRILHEIFLAGGRERSGDADFVRARYLEHPHRIQCSVALDDREQILGFQSLKRAWPENPYDVPAGWGIIGTHISPRAARRGVGAALFEVSRQAAKTAAIAMIDASIGNENQAGLAYYSALGFETYREGDGVICKVFKVG
jgi:L-amino acid N-acyltransferase YncA